MNEAGTSTRSISEPFIRRPVATTLLMVGLLLAGITGYLNLPVAALTFLFGFRRVPESVSPARPGLDLAGVGLDTVKQVQSQLEQHSYEGFLR